MKAAALIAGLLLLGAPALGQEDMVIDQGKVYVSEATACAALETKGMNAFMDSDFLTLTFPDGIQEIGRAHV